MKKSYTLIVMITVLLLMGACGNDAPEAGKIQNSEEPVYKQNTEADGQQQPTAFQAGLDFDPKSYADQVAENEQTVLEVLEKHLTALVEHDYEAFKAGFGEEKMADILGFYYGDNLQYRFTGIDSIETFKGSYHQYQIYVLGEQLDSNTGDIKEVKLMYAIRQSKQGDWSIYTID